MARDIGSVGAGAAIPERSGRVLPRIKVCGVRSIADVEPALALGLDAVGFVAHRESPRAIDAHAAHSIAAELPDSVLAIGVFVDARPGEAHAWLAKSGASCAQLCGAERAEDWRGFAFPILRRVAVTRGAEREIERWSEIALGFVLDHPRGPGGTGEAIDPAIARDLCLRGRALVAGGLAADNVERTISLVRPHGVDASSRLERAPGEKDPARVAAFVRAARAALERVFALPGEAAGGGAAPRASGGP